ncbi:hypothetical protein AVEN_143448-1 [Araneus ventricosus]|uniref:RNase H type-1 domain-containing protein n=1 Tax=Araneus ventricosus TaxID=182803 RepID=A0A4Y2HCJ2_ARAVE|nr:hypothetical protein AVEN_143448-1 [Araneus ventricosus]
MLSGFSFRRLWDLFWYPRLGWETSLFPLLTCGTQLTGGTRIDPIESQVPGSRFEVYTDGSKSDSEAGFAVCILEHGGPHEIFKFKLGVNNTAGLIIFQAELAATDFAVRWALEKKSKLILLRIASDPSRPSGSPGPGLR